MNYTNHMSPAQLAAVLTGLLLASPSVFALDAACEPVIAASAARMAQPHWHAITNATSGTLEVIKADGKFYQRPSHQHWQTAPNLDYSEQVWRENIRAGSFKLADCAPGGAQAIGDIETQIVRYRINMPGFDPRPVMLYIGKTDGLPYQQTYLGAITHYSYQTVSAPVLH